MKLGAEMKQPKYQLAPGILHSTRLILPTSFDFHRCPSAWFANDQIVSWLMPSNPLYCHSSEAKMGCYKEFNRKQLTEKPREKQMSLQGHEVNMN